MTLYYQERGKGVPLVLLHGNGEDSNYFSHQFDYFASVYRVIAVDTRGHGKSSRGDAPFTMEQFVLDLDNLLVKLKISKMVLLGFSDGANIAMKYVLKYPDKIKALILNGGNINTKGVKRRIQIPIEIGYRLNKMFSNKSDEKEKKAELLGLMVNEPNIKIEELNLIKTPTLVIAGKNDMIKESHTKLIASNIPNAELSIIDGDHFIARDKPELFNQEVEKFLVKVLKKND